MDSKASGRVVIVEDDKELLEVVGLFILELGYQVAEYSSATEALRDLQNGTLNDEIKMGRLPVILSDNFMPEMDGLTFLRVVQKNFPKIPFIMMTAFVSDEIIRVAKDAGAFK